MSRVDLTLCHGRSERCVSIRGHEFPICARCTAIYLGFLTALTFEILFGAPSRKLLAIYVLLAMPTGVDGLTQLICDRESTNLIRFLTGYPAGFGFMLFLRTIF
jgi:uncharacterized membrane protein